MQYPQWRSSGGPTPAERLVICEKCNKAEWVLHGFPQVVYCTKHDVRMREATKKEYAEAKRVLEENKGRYL